MKRRRHTPEQIIRKLREAERMLAEGCEVPEVAKALEVCEQTFHRWRAQYGGMKAYDVRRCGGGACERSAAAGGGEQESTHLLRISGAREEAPPSLAGG